MMKKITIIFIVISLSQIISFINFHNESFDKLTYYYSIYNEALQLEINSSGSFLFYHYKTFNDEFGYSGQVSEQLLKRLNEKFDYIDLNTLKKTHSGDFTLDGGIEELIVDLSDTSIRISSLGYDDTPKEVTELIEVLKESYSSIKRVQNYNSLNEFSYLLIAKHKNRYDSLYSQPLTEPKNTINEEFYYSFIIDKNPEPIGGIDAIQSRITYPETAKDSGVEGRVLIQAYIDEGGIVNKVEIIKGIGYGCDEIALAEVKNSLFTPGILRGNPVKTKIIVPLVFRK